MKNKELIEKLNIAIIESTIDFAKKSLSNEVWDKEGEKYKLKDSIYNTIFKALKSFNRLNLIDIADEIRIIGSITTNLYTPSTDIDIHIVPNTQKLKQLGENAEELQKEIKKYFKDSKFIEEHPLEFYLQLNPKQDLLSDGVYNLKTNNWIKGPKIYPLNYNPYKIYNKIFKLIKNKVKDADSLILDLRRNIIDYTTIIKNIAELPKDVQKELQNELRKEEEQIKSNIEQLFIQKKKFADIRKKTSSGKELSKSWNNANVEFKAIFSLYTYGKLIDHLQQLIEDKEISKEDIEKINNYLKDFISNGDYKDAK